ncbi:MAG: aminopeptidase, partial [Bergeyella sp.]
MRYTLLFFVLFLANAVKITAQQDSIFIQAKISQDRKSVDVVQEIFYINKTGKELSQIKLLNWISAYKNRKTSLLKRQLEDRKKNLYFSKPEELGNLANLELSIGNSAMIGLDTNRQNLYIPLNNPLKDGERITLSLKYTLMLPNSSFTGYGTSEKNISLKYFFLVPDSFEAEDSSEKHFINIEETQNFGSWWKVMLDVPAGYFTKSNLPETFPNYYEGIMKTDPEFVISAEHYPSVETEIQGKKVKIDFGYTMNQSDLQNLEFYLPLQLKFINEKTGLLPEKIFISEKLKKEEDFFGNDDIRFWKFHYKLFTDAENADMDYFGIVAKNILNQSVIYNKKEDHWLINGVKTYLEFEYLKEFYSNKKLLGDLPEQVKLFGMKPLNWFYASELKLTDRYGLGYQYIASENLDQKIAEPYQRMSNFNRTAISHFETGSLLNFIAEKTGKEKFEIFLKKEFSEANLHRMDAQKFIDGLALVSGYSSHFLNEFIKRKHRVNFTLKKFKKEGENFQVTIAKNTPEKIPFKIETEEQSGETKTFWFDTSSSEKSEIYNIPHSDASKILVNNDYSFPESNYRDNYLYTQGIFANRKRLKFKLFRDIPNPEYNEIYLNPRATFNAYDKVLLGLNFKNTSMFRRKFAYSVTPYYSTGTGKLTGSGSVS